MNVSMKWLKSYVDIDVPVNEYCDAMTMSGTKVENYVVTGKDIDKVVVGKILSIEKHPDADKLVVTQVDVGNEVIQIVTGANNISENDYVPIALCGSTLPGGINIKKGKLRGIPSNGMMCAIEELGLTKEQYPDAEEHGIYIFKEPKELGSDVKPYFGLGDEIVEYEITSNRPDCFSVIGIAREAAVTFEKELKIPKNNYTTHPIKEEDKVNVVIEDSDLCNRFVGRVVTDIKIEDSPEWMKERLISAGIGPINNIVDITNYVMLECGQPMHAYDMDYLKDREIHVRRAKNGEKMMTLDGEERILDDTMLVIADQKNPTGAAGIMGGEESKIHETTNKIFFEVANFDGTSIRKTSKKLGLRTDASSKFEKKLDPNNALIAMERALTLIEELGAGKITDYVIDEYPVVRKEKTISYDVAKINSRLGINLSEDEMLKIFERLEFKVNKENKELIIPTFRPDININADLSEDIARIYGYNNIPETLDCATPTAGAKTLKQKIEDMTSNIMVACGFSEAKTYSFESPKVFKNLGIEEGHKLYEHISIVNPLGEDFSVMRTSTINGMLVSLANNYNRRNENVSLFEIGRTYVPKELPLNDYAIEKDYVTLGMYGEVDFFNLKGVVETYLNQLGIFDLTYSKDIDMPFLHPGRKAAIMYKGKNLGYLGQVHPNTLDNYNLNIPIYVATMDLAEVVALTNLTREFKQVPKFPAVNRDLALMCKKEIEVGQLDFLIKQRGGKLLESFSLFDVYEGSQIPEGFKSVAYSLTFRASDHTLEEEEINKFVKKILKGLEFELGVTIRQ